MAPSRRGGSSRLGESWVVHDTDGSDASFEDDAHPQSLPARRVAKGRNPAERDAQTPLRSPKARQRSSRASSTVAPPELIMPSLHADADDGSFFQGGLPSKDDQTRKRSTKNGRSSSPASRNGNGNDKGAQARFRIGRTSPAQTGGPDMSDTVVKVLGNVAEWLFDILGGALKALKKPISWVLAIYAFAALLTFAQNLLTNSVYSALSPICRLPGSSFLHLPMCQSSTSALKNQDAAAVVEFDQLMSVQSRFEDVLQQSAAGVGLPLDMKRGETSIRDLRQIVRFSQLSSRNELVLEFDGFIETARIASYDLQKFNSHVGRGVDNVLSTARWTQRVLDDLAVKQTSRGVIPSFINDKLLAPFQASRSTESRILDQYIQHTKLVSEEIETLITEAQALLWVLQNLEDRLDVIHGIAYRDHEYAQDSKDDVLSQLWTRIGGNRASLAKHDKQIMLLRQCGEYRKTAWAHVSSTILKLQAMRTELEELRERVGSAELLRDRADIPLAVHLESIRLGVERLEQGRESTRESQRNYMQGILDKGADPEMRLLVEG